MPQLEYEIRNDDEGGEPLISNGPENKFEFRYNTSQIWKRCYCYLMIENLRLYRIGGYAIFDLVTAFLGMYLLSPLLSWLFRQVKIDIPKQNWLFLTLPISILVHLLVNNKTLMAKNFLDLQGNFILKILILGLLVLGLRGIKITK